MGCLPIPEKSSMNLIAWSRVYHVVQRKGTTLDILEEVLLFSDIAKSECISLSIVWSAQRQFEVPADDN